MRRDRFRDFNFIKGGSKGILRDTVYPFALSASRFKVEWRKAMEGKRRESAQCCIANSKENPGIVKKMQRRQCVDRIDAWDMLYSLKMKWKFLL